MEWHYTVGEVFFPGQGYAIPAYTRTSLLFSSLAIMIIAIDKRIKSNYIVGFMARYSLSLYCIHPFLMGPVKAIALKFTHNDIVLNYSSIGLVILLSYCIAIILGFYLKKEVIM
jgi:peptidoglycan/LPS O-acetylase OafA/YrhL